MLTELIDRLTKAEAGSRELDADIAVAVRCMTTVSGDDVPAWAAMKFPVWRSRGDGFVEVVHSNGTSGLKWRAPWFTESLDAAMSLAPEGCEWELSYLDDKYQFKIGDPLLFISPEAPTKELAVCIGALRFIEHMRKADHEAGELAALHSGAGVTTGER